MFSLLLLALGIHNAANYTVTNVKKGILPIVEYKIDFAKWNDYESENGIAKDEEGRIVLEQYGIITNNQIDELIKNDDRIVSVSAMPTVGLSDGIAYNFIPIKEINSDYYQFSNYKNEEDTLKIRLNANRYPVFIGIDLGYQKLIDGRVYDQNDIDNQNNVVVITKELAELNNLKLGDFIRFCVADFYFTMDNQAKKFAEFADADVIFPEFEIIGIIEMDYPSTEINWVVNSTSTIHYNNVFLPGTTYAKWAKRLSEEEIRFDQANGKSTIPLYNELDYLYYNEVYIQLEDYSMIPSFIEDHQNKIKEYQVLSSSLENVDQLSRSMDMLSYVANIIFYSVLFNLVIIFSLIIFLRTYKRRKEIGVLLSLGINRMKILMQFVIESSILICIGFSFALVFSNHLAEKVGEAALNYQIEINEQRENNTVSFEQDAFTMLNFQNNFMSIVDEENFINAYHVEMTLNLVVEMIGYCLIVLFISTLVPVYMLIRLEPKKILMEV